MNPSKASIATWFKSLQDEICAALAHLDGGSFHEDLWQRHGGGGGRTRILEGSIFEKGGVNFSEVHGTLSESAAESLRMPADDFFATGVSIVIHPSNPFVPIIHMNVRFFEMAKGTWWFGGGIDLTPHYVNESEACFFHQALKEVCDTLSSDSYAKYKKWADEYFYLKHRKETRGIGGIFFDRLGYQDSFDRSTCWQFVQDVGRTFLKVYLPMVNHNKDNPFSADQKLWQQLRRSRYVEFNLLYDRGTRFGLETNGRTESILMSMPPHADWVYNFQARKESPEHKTLSLLKKEIDWLKDTAR